MTWTQLNYKCFCPQWIIYYVHAESCVSEKWRLHCVADLQFHVHSRFFLVTSRTRSFKVILKCIDQIFFLTFW